MKTNIKSFTKFILTSFFSIIYFSVFSQNAKVQVIHNSPGAPAVDVWVNGSTVLSGVIFRQASGFLDVPVTTPTTVQIAVTGSNPYTIVSTDVLTLTSDMSYRAIATGVVGTTVSGQEFDVTYFGATTTTVAGFTGLDIYHSSPDAPAVGVVARGVATLVSSFSFKESADNVSVPSDSYTLDINAGNGSGATVASFTAPLSGFAGKNIAVLASGLLSGTPSFGLIAVASDGTVVELPAYVAPAPAKVQVIHNSPGAPAVDVWVNGSTVLSGVIFRQASGFLDVPVTTPTTVQIAVTGSNPYTIVSTDVLTLTSNMSYRAIATGIVGTTVSGQEFDVTYFGATTTTVAGFTGLDIYHSSPDAPAVGVVARGVATLVSSFLFKESADNVSVPSDSYTLDINAGNGSGATVASFTAPLSGFAGKNIAVLASGLLSGTPSFGLIAVASDGTVIELPSSPTSTKGASKLDAIIYPNPVSDILNVNVLKPGNYTYNLVNALGVSSSFSSSIISVSGLSSGIYILQVIENGEVKASQKVLVK